MLIPDNYDEVFAVGCVWGRGVHVTSSRVQ